MVDNATILDKTFDAHVYKEKKINHEGRIIPRILIQKSGSKESVFTVSLRLELYFSPQQKDSPILLTTSRQCN